MKSKLTKQEFLTILKVVGCIGFNHKDCEEPRFVINFQWNHGMEGRFYENVKSLIENEFDPKKYFLVLQLKRELATLLTDTKETKTHAMTAMATYFKNPEVYLENSNGVAFIDLQNYQNDEIINELDAMPFKFWEYIDEIQQNLNNVTTKSKNFKP